MMSKTLYIIRGLPGSGKSTLGDKLAGSYVDYHPKFGGPKCYNYAADDWFTDKDGNYCYVPEEIDEAHEDCRSRVMGAMMSTSADNICVCNTFTQAWEAEPYFKLCESYGYTPVVIECQSQFGNIHGCPESKVQEMKDRWDDDIVPEQFKQNKQQQEKNIYG